MKSLSMEYRLHTGEFLTYDLCMRGGDLAEKLFNTHGDPTQEPITRDQIDWIYASLPECNTVATWGADVVADALVVPILRADAYRFVEGELGEPELLRAARHVDKRSCDALYLCSVAVDPNHRGVGLGFHAFLRSVQCARSRLVDPNPLLVVWPWSEAGLKIVEYIAKDQNLELQLKRA